MQQLRLYFGSVSFGMYDAVGTASPEIKAWLDAFELPEDVQRMDGAKQLGFTGNDLLEAPLEVNRYALLDSLNKYKPQSKNYVMFWSKIQQLQRPGGSAGRVLYLYRSEDARRLPKISNTMIRHAGSAVDQFGQKIIEMEFTDEGREAFTQMTTEAYQDQNRCIGMVLNGEVWANPSVRGAITGGKSVITGNAPMEDLDRIARQLVWNPLPVKLKIISQQVLTKK